MLRNLPASSGRESACRICPGLSVLLSWMRLHSLVGPYFPPSVLQNFILLLLPLACTLCHPGLTSTFIDLELPPPPPAPVSMANSLGQNASFFFGHIYQIALDAPAGCTVTFLSNGDVNVGPQEEVWQKAATATAMIDIEAEGAEESPAQSLCRHVTGTFPPLMENETVFLFRRRLRVLPVPYDEQKEGEQDAARDAVALRFSLEVPPEVAPFVRLITTESSTDPPAEASEGGSLVARIPDASTSHWLLDTPALYW